MDFEDYEDFEDNLFDKEEPPTEELNDDEVLNKVIKKTEPRLVQPKKIVNRKPRVTLNEHVLTGPKGLCALRKSFEKWHPHKEKSPYENLNEMMEKVEYWGHLLHPQLNFDDLITKLENVGKKRAVKVYMTKLRLGMPLFEDDDKREVNDDDRRSESPQKEHSPLPSDDDDFADETLNNLFNEEVNSHDASQKGKQLVVKDSRKEVGPASSRSQKQIFFEDSDDEIDAPISKKTLIEASPVVEKKKRPAVDDSDEETDVGSPHSQKKKRIIFDDSDEEIDELATKEILIEASPVIEKKKRLLVEDSDEEDDPASPHASQKKKRRVLDYSDDEVDSPAVKENEEISEDTALDYIFDDF